jgi:hypothetical protein
MGVQIVSAFHGALPQMRPTMAPMMPQQAVTNSATNENAFDEAKQRTTH